MAAFKDKASHSTRRWAAVSTAVGSHPHPVMGTSVACHANKSKAAHTRTIGKACVIIAAGLMQFRKSVISQLRANTNYISFTFEFNPPIFNGEFSGCIAQSMLQGRTSNLRRVSTILVFEPTSASVIFPSETISLSLTV
ncbi:hypothetical protein [Novosphingobium pentaromativorans]|uniref:hypothetical protein n=1 Tax=Novosphingobium pentaromativorans TaxID=205844 RepID=UPI00139223CD|nr:hypothetical protein [Novosphingobium pentaromativorans]